MWQQCMIFTSLVGQLQDEGAGPPDILHNIVVKWLAAVVYLLCGFNIPEVKAVSHSTRV